MNYDTKGTTMTYPEAIRGAFHDNFAGFLGFRFLNKLVAHEKSTRHIKSEQT